MKEKGLDQLILYEGFKQEALVRKTCALFQQLVYRNTPFSPVAEETVSAADYYEVQRSLLEAAHVGEGISARGGISATVWQHYIAGITGSADNIFSRMAEKGASDENIDALAAEELRVVRFLYRFDFAALARAVEAQTGIRSGSENIGALRMAEEAQRQHIHAALSAETEQDSVTALADYYRCYGSGIFEASAAFSWDGSLSPVRHDSSVTMDSIIGYERQKARLIQNTELLMAGLPASNVLLYGDSGTGKSSSVKALLSRFAGKGLKLISLPKARLGEITKIIDLISGRGLKYLLFIDDLSFDEGENEYKAFKSAIEGRVTSAKTNWIVCVTSNRRNIVKEVWKDRETQDDVHLRDNLQEKKSLADRFGLTIVYEAPDKREYLEIVRGLAAEAGLALSGDELDSAAMTWEIRHGGRSGRTARGFVEHRYALEQKGH
ncbi:MAG: ATP-binding protein [Clostridiales Family XIII bacterium]|jgi:predicted AAA+ superfamily ATPase|nr:ATP-binding protein [Clostridiales Family XIII bacterium]